MSVNIEKNVGLRGSGAVAQSNRVLRNTYILLALSMVPTVFGAWLGMQMKFSFFAGSPFMGFIAFLAITFGFFWAINKTKDSALGVLILLGFTLFMGLILSSLLGVALQFSNGPKMIMTAFGGTATIFAVMATIATVSKRDFSGMGKWLFVGTLVILVAMLANIWLQMPALQLALSAMCVLIFSAYILYDVQQVVNGGETNYIMATLQIYLNVYMIFTHLLSMLMALTGERD
jgi:modulator of FtsH protease